MHAAARTLPVLFLLAGCLGEAPHLADDESTSTSTSWGSSTSTSITTAPSTSDVGTSSGAATTSVDTTTTSESSGEADGSSTTTETSTPTCTLAAQWEIVDELDGEAGLGAQARGIAADDDVIWVAGNADGRWCVRRSDDRGESWTTVDTNDSDVAEQSGATGVAIAGSGTIFVVGASTVNGGQAQRVVRRSLDGTTWATVDTFALSPEHATYASAIASAPDGTVYTAGQASSPTNAHWLVRATDDEGESWSTVDDWQLQPGMLCIPFGLAVDEDGLAYAAGHCNDADLVSHGIVRRRSADGTWSTIDDFLAGDVAATGSASSITVGGRLLVAASGFDNGAQHWLVRASDDGATWTTLDDHVAAEGGVSAASVYDDGNGTLVAVGSLTAELPHMRTRRSTDDGATWETIDDFSYEAGIYGGRLVADASGDLFVTGIGLTAGTNRWLVRRMTCEER